MDNLMSGGIAKMIGDKAGDAVEGIITNVMGGKKDGDEAGESQGKGGLDLGGLGDIAGNLTGGSKDKDSNALGGLGELAGKLTGGSKDNDSGGLNLASAAGSLFG